MYTSGQVALLAGGLLSTAQQIWDAAVINDWGVVSSNLTKLLLAVLTAAFSTALLLRECELPRNWPWQLISGSDRRTQKPEPSSSENQERLEALNEALVG